MSYRHASKLAVRTALCAASFAFAAPVLAGGLPKAGVAALPAVASIVTTTSCNAQPAAEPQTRFGAVRETSLASKSSAILGGSPSALDLVRAQQEGAAGTGIAALEATDQLAGPARSAPTWCPTARTFTPTVTKPIVSQPGRGTGFLASRRVQISRTSFDAEWDRVAVQSVGRVRGLDLPVGRAEPEDMIRAVNGWVNREIEFVEDRVLFGKSDYWAGANVTMALRQGDCEDIALTKMQILAANGIDRRDMFLTIARDRVRRADHALLVVRLGDRFVVLDNTTDELLDGAYAHDYLPLLSYSQNGSWVHGI